MREALTNRITSGGINVVRLHYAADPDKDPSTPDGAEWVQSQLQGYPGGFENAAWRKEMEIMYSAGGGELVFRKFSDWRVSSNIFIEEDPDISGAKLYGSYDHGWTNPACYLVHAVYPGGLKRTLWECHGPEIPVPNMAAVIRGEDTITPKGVALKGNPYAGKEVFMVADPEIERRNQVMYQGGNKSIAKMFADCGVYFQMGKRGDDMSVINYMLGTLWEDPMFPLYQICRNCKYLIWELGGLKHPKIEHLKNQKEAIVDRDNHAFDALKYFLSRFPVVNRPVKKKEAVATFDWWCDVADNHRKGKLAPTYYREMVR